MNSDPCILCYPNFTPNDLNGIKHALLLGERVSVIAPTLTPNYCVPEANVDPAKPEGTEIKSWGALTGVLKDCRLDDGLSAIDLIYDGEIAGARPTEFKSALSEDLADPEVAAWAAKIQAAHPGRMHFWHIRAPYFKELLKMDIDDASIQSHYCLHRVGDPKLEDLIRVPFIVGMSLGLSEALWGAVDKGRSLFTVDPISADFLLMRLRRGWRLLGNDSTLQRNLDIKLAKDSSANQLSAWTLGFAAPGLFDKVQGMSLEEVMALRKNADKEDALSEYRNGMARIVSEQELWGAKDFQSFRVAAENAVHSLKPAYEALSQKTLDVKDVVTALNPAVAAANFVKDIPKLFVSGATATTMGGSVALAGGYALVPAAVFALACGLTGTAVAEVVEKWSGRLRERRDAQFLRYSIRLREAL